MRRGRSLCIATALALGASSSAHAARPVIAIFDLESEGSRLKSAELDRLTDYLAAQVTATGRFQVVPRRELKAALARQKKASYKACYDESCQIEIGKELAAEKSLAGRISKFGKSCLITLKLFDLAKATAEAAGTARGSCNQDDVLTSLEKAVAQLAHSEDVITGQDTPPPPPPPKTPRIQGADYGDLETEMKAAAAEAARDAAARQAREEAARRDWAKLQRFLTAKGIKPERKLQVLQKFLARFPEDNPHRYDAEAAMDRLQQADGMIFIPGGTFYMGCNTKNDSECDSDEKPGRTVRVDGFYIDRTEVTKAAYRRCVNAGACTTTGLKTTYQKGTKNQGLARSCVWKQSGKNNHPMNCLTWYQADAYCRWAGKRLPTGKQWEKAARGIDGRKYPWGDRRPARGMRIGNTCDEAAKRKNTKWRIFNGYDDGYVETSPVGTYPDGRSPYGVDDMFGNVWEWVSDPEKSGKRAMRGCSWSSRPKLCRVSNIKWLRGDSRRGSYGFRCAK